LDSCKIKLTIAYDGTQYSGWQIQKFGTGVQEKVEAALAKLFPTHPRLHSSSRTDTGVHALGMIAHFEVPRAAYKMASAKLQLALNAWLPADIRVTSVSRAPKAASAGSVVARFFPSCPTGAVATVGDMSGTADMSRVVCASVVRLTAAATARPKAEMLSAANPCQSHPLPAAGGGSALASGYPSRSVRCSPRTRTGRASSSRSAARTGGTRTSACSSGTSSVARPDGSGGRSWCCWPPAWSPTSSCCRPRVRCSDRRPTPGRDTRRMTRSVLPSRAPLVSSWSA